MPEQQQEDQPIYLSDKQMARLQEYADKQGITPAAAFLQGLDAGFNDLLEINTPITGNVIQFPRVGTRGNTSPNFK